MTRRIGDPPRRISPLRVRGNSVLRASTDLPECGLVALATDLRDDGRDVGTWQRVSVAPLRLHLDLGGDTTLKLDEAVVAVETGDRRTHDCCCYHNTSSLLLALLVTA